MDAARSALQGAHYYHAGVNYVLPELGIKKGAWGLQYFESSLHQLGSRPIVFIPRWTTHPCILYQVCVTPGAGCGCCGAVVKYSLTTLMAQGLNPDKGCRQVKNPNVFEFVQNEYLSTVTFPSLLRPQGRETPFRVISLLQMTYLFSLMHFPASVIQLLQFWFAGSIHRKNRVLTASTLDTLSTC